MLNVRVLTKYAHLWEEFALTLENASSVLLFMQQFKHGQYKLAAS